MVNEKIYHYVGLIFDGILYTLIVVSCLFNIYVAIAIFILYFSIFMYPPSYHINQYLERLVDIASKEEMRQIKEEARYSCLIGEKAISSTNLSPLGYVMIKDIKVEAQAQCGYVSADSEVKIIGAKKHYVIVEKFCA